MSDIPFPSNPQTETEYETTLDQMLIEIQRLNEQMQQDQADIDRLRAESAFYKAESQRLKAEGKQMGEEARVRLARLHASLDQLVGVA